MVVQQFKKALAQEDIHAPTFLARLYASARPLDHRKRAGQFFTSGEVANWAVSLVQPGPDDHVCDAGAGAGTFGEAIVTSGLSIRSYIGVENDPTLALCAAHVLDVVDAPESFRVWYANFLLLNEGAFRAHGLVAPTLVIANPPFVRSQNLAGRARILSSLRAANLGSCCRRFLEPRTILSRAAESHELDEKRHQWPRRRPLIVLVAT